MSTGLESITPSSLESVGVRGARRLQMKFVQDFVRGHLSVGNFEDAEIPFVPRRFFLTYGIPTAEEVRGQHAHRECHQFLVCVAGSCVVLVDDGLNQARVTLDGPNVGLYVPPMVWAEETAHTKDACLLVFASHAYDSADYIRDYQEFLHGVFQRDADAVVAVSLARSADTPASHP